MNSTLYAGLRYQAFEAAAKVMGIAVQPLGVREPDDFEYHRWLLEGTIPRRALYINSLILIIQPFSSWKTRVT
jgi:hypothetical protein